MTEHGLWTEWHLTPCGWVRGSEKSELGSVFTVERAVGTVMTCRYEEAYQDDDPQPVRAECREVWRSPETPEMERLVRIFGECPRML